MIGVPKHYAPVEKRAFGHWVEVGEFDIKEVAALRAFQCGPVQQSKILLCWFCHFPARQIENGFYWIMTEVRERTKPDSLRIGGKIGH